MCRIVGESHYYGLGGTALSSDSNARQQLRGPREPHPNPKVSRLAQGLLGRQLPLAVTTLTHSGCLQQKGAQSHPWRRWHCQPLGHLLTSRPCLPAPTLPNETPRTILPPREGGAGQEAQGQPSIPRLRLAAWQDSLAFSGLQPLAHAGMGPATSRTPPFCWRGAEEPAAAQVEVQTQVAPAWRELKERAGGHQPGRRPGRAFLLR